MTSPLNLAFCLFHYFPHGGLQRDFLRIAKTCQNRGHQIHIYTMSWEGELPEGFHLHILPTKGHSNASRATHFGEALVKALSLTSYDRVIGFNRLPGLDIYFAADRCYQENARAKYSTWHRASPRYRQYVALERAVFSPGTNTQILLLNARDQSIFQTYYHTPASRFHVLPVAWETGAQYSRLDPNGRLLRRKMLGLTSEQKLILMVGSGFKNKGVDRALHALAELPKTQRAQTSLWIAGKGKTWPWRWMAYRLGISSHVRFLGTREDIGELMQAADLLIHPARVETAGMVLLEALRSGLPVLVTGSCGYAEQVRLANAGQVLPEPFQQTTLNKMLSEMLTSPLQETWRKNGPAYVKQSEHLSLTATVVAHIENTPNGSSASCKNYPII